MYKFSDGIASFPGHAQRGLGMRLLRRHKLLTSSPLCMVAPFSLIVCGVILCRNCFTSPIVAAQEESGAERVERERERGGKKKDSDEKEKRG